MMLLGHIALGIYTLSLTAGFFALSHMTDKAPRLHNIATAILMVVETAGIGCVLYYLATHGIIG